MDIESRLGNAVTVVWIGTAAALVLGTAALSTLFPAVPRGVTFVLWGASLPAPFLTTYWIYRHAPEDAGTPTTHTRRDEPER